MGLVLNTNRLSLDSQFSLRSNARNIEITSRRLSSGKRVNSAADDAAGMTISQRLISDTKALRKAMQNSLDGISMAEVAESQLGQLQGMFQRVRELMIQGASGTNGVQEKNAIQREINSLVKDIQDTAHTTKFNGINLLDGDEDGIIQSGISFSEFTTIQFGSGRMIDGTIGTPASHTLDYNKGIRISVFMSDIDPSRSAQALQADITAGTYEYNNYIDDALTAIQTDLGIAAGNALFDYLETRKSGNANEADTVETTLQNLYDAHLGGTAPAVTESDWEVIKGYLHRGGAVVEGTSGIGTLTEGFTLAKLRVEGASLASFDGSNYDYGTLDDVSNMIDNLSRMRSHLGSINNSLQTKINSFDVAAQNLETSNSRIVDADYALESSNNIKYQILQQAGVSMLSQANSFPQSIVQLLG